MTFTYLSDTIALKEDKSCLLAGQSLEYAMSVDHPEFQSSHFIEVGENPNNMLQGTYEIIRLLIAEVNNTTVKNTFR